MGKIVKLAEPLNTTTYKPDIQTQNGTGNKEGK